MFIANYLFPREILEHPFEFANMFIEWESFRVDAIDAVDQAFQIGFESIFQLANDCKGIKNEHALVVLN
jgi:hypothetical protein